VKIFKVLSILSGLFICLLLITVSLGWIKFFSAINPLMIGFLILALATAINLNRIEKIGIHWIAYSLAFIGFLILLMGVFQIIPLKSFWHYGMATLSSSIVIGLYSQFHLITRPARKIHYFSLLIALIILIILALIALRTGISKVYYFGKIALIIFTILTLVGSFLKTEKSN
jgi:hypothetical protein